MQPQSEDTSREKKRAEWLKIKKRAAGNLLGCFLFIVLACLPIVCIKLFAQFTAYQAPNALFTIPLVKIENEVTSFAVAMVFTLLFGGAVACGVWERFRYSGPIALLLFVGIATLPVWMWYGHFVLVSGDNAGQVELRYMWPRPSMRVNAGRLGDIRVVETGLTSDDYSDEGHFKLLLEVELDGVRYQSFPTNSASKVFEADHRLLREKCLALLRVFDTSEKSTTVEAAQTWMELGTACLAIKKNEEARDAFKRALALMETAYGPASVQASRASFALGQAYHVLKDYSHAEECYKRTLEIQKATGMDSNEPDYQDAHIAYDNLLKETGRENEMSPLPRPAYTLMTDLIRRYGKEGARKKMEEMMEARRSGKGK